MKRSLQSWFKLLIIFFFPVLIGCFEAADHRQTALGLSFFQQPIDSFLSDVENDFNIGYEEDESLGCSLLINADELANEFAYAGQGTDTFESRDTSACVSRVIEPLFTDENEGMPTSVPVLQELQALETVISLQRQKRGREPGIRFKCTHESCEFDTAHKGNLTEHMRTHTGERSYLCTYEGCTYAAVKKSYLIQHMRRHTGERPYVCTHESCSYTAARKSTLDEHMSKHTGERPYVCTHEGCSYTAARKSYLVVHMRRHTGIKPYVCTQDGCVFAAINKSHLTEHMRRHTGERPYVCTYEGCSYATVRKIDLNKHTRMHNNVTPLKKQRTLREEHAPKR